MKCRIVQPRQLCGLFARQRCSRIKVLSMDYQSWSTASTVRQMAHNLFSSWHCHVSLIQLNLDMTDSMGPGKLVRHMQNPSYKYDEYLICI